MVSLTFGLAQLNPTVGDLKGNADKILAAYDRAKDAGADMLITSEMVLSGYQIEDLAFNEGFLRACQRQLESLAEATADGPAMLVGAPRLAAADEADETDYSASALRLRGRIHNSVFLLADGKIQTFRDKVYLPTYGVFDELRCFSPGQFPSPVFFKGVRLGLPICEDVWHEDICECLMESGADILIALNGSVFAPSLREQRLNMAMKRVVEHGKPFVYTNLVGAQDRLVFDGGAFALNADKQLVMQAPHFEEAFFLLRYEDGDLSSDMLVSPPSSEEALYQTALMGLRDYMAKTGFQRVMLGLSGGIDSALTAIMAVDALGADKVSAYMLPSRYTSAESLQDAEALAEALGISYRSLPITGPVEAIGEVLAEPFAGREADETEENIQSRSRGLLLMALSNKTGDLLLTTGNKSEVAVGYATLYGDMCGALNLIGDLYKTQVFEISRWRNQTLPKGALGPSGEVMPDRIITKAPSAELREDQTDQDSLPDYAVLDAVLHGLVEQEKSPAEMVAAGFEKAVVKQVWRLLHISEFKRRQAAPAIKLSERCFGLDRRIPIVNAYWRQAEF